MRGRRLVVGGVVLLVIEVAAIGAVAAGAWMWQPWAGWCVGGLLVLVELNFKGR